MHAKYCERYFTKGLKKQAEMVYQNCIRCRRICGKPSHPKMGPVHEVTEIDFNKRAEVFKNIQIDISGPLLRGKKKIKKFGF